MSVTVETILKGPENEPPKIPANPREKLGKLLCAVNEYKIDHGIAGNLPVMMTLLPRTQPELGDISIILVNPDAHLRIVETTYGAKNRYEYRPWVVANINWDKDGVKDITFPNNPTTTDETDQKQEVLDALERMWKNSPRVTIGRKPTLEKRYPVEEIEDMTVWAGIDNDEDINGEITQEEQEYIIPLLTKMIKQMRTWNEERIHVTGSNRLQVLGEIPQPDTVRALQIYVNNKRNRIYVRESVSPESKWKTKWKHAVLVWSDDEKNLEINALKEKEPLTQRQKRLIFRQVICFLENEQRFEVREIMKINGYYQTIFNPLNVENPFRNGATI